MNTLYKPEGELSGTARNREYLSSVAGLEKAMQTGAAVEAPVIRCDSNLCLHVDLQVAEGLMEASEAVFCRPDELLKDIAIVSRVGKPVTFRILSVKTENGKTVARLSRRSLQKDCLDYLLQTLRPGDLTLSKVTHLEPFGAFLDIGCGVSALLSVDCISVARISHPKDRLTPGTLLTTVVKSIDKRLGRIYLTLRELLGSWEENASLFHAGETVTGILRSVESYGAFVELTPNLAGLCEVRSQEQADSLRPYIGKGVAVYIKSIVPERMKIKLVLIDCENCVAPKKQLKYFIDTSKVFHLPSWVYSPDSASKRVETLFDAPDNGTENTEIK